MSTSARRSEEEQMLCIRRDRYNRLREWRGIKAAGTIAAASRGVATAALALARFPSSRRPSLSPTLLAPNNMLHSIFTVGVP